MSQIESSSVRSSHLLIILLLSFGFMAAAAPGGNKGKSGGSRGGGGGNNKSLAAIDDYLLLKANSTASVNVLENGDSGFKISVIRLNGESSGQWLNLTSKARVFISSSGDLTFDPNGAFDQYLEGESAKDSLTYTISDRDGQTATATVHVTIEGVLPKPQNQPPIGEEDSASLQEDTSVTIDLLANDSDPDGDPLSVLWIGDPNNGSLSLQANGSVIYSPDLNFKGTDNFTYTLSDGQPGHEINIAVNVTVVAVNDSPVAVNDSFTITAGETLSGSVLSNDFDVDQDTLVVKGFDSLSTYGCEVVMSPNGSFSFSTSCGVIGVDNFHYSISDGSGATATGTVTVKIEEENSIPYYVEALLQDAYRMNYPEPYGTPVTVTFYFPDSTPSYYEETHYAYNDFHAFTEGQRIQTREMLEYVSSYANIEFVEVTNEKESEITFAFAGCGCTGAAVTPGRNWPGGPDNDIWISSRFYEDPLTAGSDVRTTVLHEIGHVLGFGHIVHGEVPNSESNQMYSVMSAAESYGGMNPTTFMLFDIATFQFIYGANQTTNAGDTTYTFQDLNQKLISLWDAGGYDRIDLSDAYFGVGIDLREGQTGEVLLDDWSTNLRSMSLAFGTIIEEAIGGPYDDWFVSNDVANRLTGGAGSDRFIFYVNWGQDTITDFEPGVDKLDFSQSGLSYTDLSVTSTSSQTTISYEENQIILEGVSSIQLGDFLF